MNFLTRKFLFVAAVSILLLTTLFFSCGVPTHLSSQIPLTGSSASQVSASLEIMDTLCAKIIQAHPSLTMNECTSGVSATSFGAALGVPPGILDPFIRLEQAEAAGKAPADPNALGVCLNDVMALDSNSPAVQAAYDPTAHHPFDGVIDMVPQGPDTCASVFGVGLPSFTAPVDPSTGTLTIVTFDAPAVAALPGALLGLFYGIDFSNQWRLQGPYGADPGASIYFAGSSAPGSGNLNLPAWKTLVSLNVFNADMNGATGIITVYDASGGINVAVSASIPTDNQLHLIQTQWQHPAVNPVTISFSGGWTLGVDDITYQ